MLTVIFIAKVLTGQESAFETTLSQLAEDIANEPGCAGVTWGPTETPGEYALIERYKDMDALEAHRASRHMKELGPPIFAMLDGAPVITRFVEERAL
ncbi:putative quinol monooxygenase [Croceicoccus sediminis]|uniref:putative quinol monooxygenase n=1 Tax=Croceicoccus sediminis TaxID=2571150 RepID=UPI0014797FB0|nr:putative quinol monooxygenase [Croceicoccus sediminis]